MRAQLEQVEKSTGHRDSLLDSVVIPDGFRYLWELFWEIRSGSSEGMSGSKVTWRDLSDYQALTGITLDAWEIEAVMAMDSAIRG